MRFAIYPKMLLAGLAVAAVTSGWGAERTLSGVYAVDQTITATEDTTVNLNGVTFTDAKLKLEGNVDFTLNLVPGTQNVFTQTSANEPCIKATKSSNIVIAGTGSLSLYSKKKLDGTEGVLTCNDLTVTGGDTKIEFDNDKSDTPCVFLKGNYLQTGGKLKVEASKKNCTNEFAGVHFDTKNTTFTLVDGTFNAAMAGTKSRAVDLRGSCGATFKGGKCKMSFEGPEGRFVSGGTLVFEGGSFDFTTNITAKMTAAYYPVNLSAVKADYTIAISGGEFEADLPLAGSEVFTTDGETGTTITISGGDLDLVSGDDCINAMGDITITGGRLRCISVYDDAIDANGSMTISGGDIRAYATAVNTHGMDVNKGSRLTINGGIIVATDGPDTEMIGSGSPDVGKRTFNQPTYYGVVAANDFSAKYLRLEGETNGVAFVVKPRLPAFPAGSSLNLLVSVPGCAASVPVPKTLAEAYADVNSRTPAVFEKKATVAGNTITTKEGELFALPSYYDLTPAEGKTKTVSVALNASAAPEYSDLARDGVAAIALGETVNVGVKTHAGLLYRLVTANAPTTPLPWPVVGEAVAGDGSVKTLTAPRAGGAAFFKVRVCD